MVFGSVVFKRVVCVGGFCAALAAGTVPGLAQTSAAVQFVEDGTSKATSILQDKALSPADRRKEVAALITTLLDLKRMAIFTLGPAAKTASPADIDAFEDAYRDFALANYTAELGAYTGQTLEVTNAMERAPGDYIISGVVHDPSERPGQAPAQVSFRVLDEDGHHALVDASVEGVWFTLAQRSDFMGFLGQNGGDIGKLTDHLKAMAGQAAQMNPAPRQGS